jgi:hypothetical protein
MSAASPVRIAWLLLLAICPLALAEPAAAIAPRWAPDILGVQDAAQIGPALKRPFDTAFKAYVRLPGGRRKVTIDSCLAWQAWRGKITGTEPESEFVTLRGQGLECDALVLVRDARAATRSALPADLATLTAARLYPGSLWLAVSDEEVERRARPGTTLAASSGKSEWTSDRNGLLLEDQDGGVRLVWVARADFDGDGWEDALYRWQAWLRGGTWTDMRLVVLTRHGPDAALVVVAPASSRPRTGLRTKEKAGNHEQNP